MTQAVSPPPGRMRGNFLGCGESRDKLRSMAEDHFAGSLPAGAGWLLSFALVFISFLSVSSMGGEPPVNRSPRVLPEGQLPNDMRLGPLKDLDGYFPFKPCESPAQWAARAGRVRRELAVAVGLWPMPEKTPLNAVIHGKIERPGYTIEKVYFESIPGFFVTGNLYRPTGKTGRRPGVLSPHGHWKDGRFLEDAPDYVSKEIADGAEKFADGGRSPLQARCVQL